MLEQVVELHKKFRIGYEGAPRHLDPAEKTFRVEAIREEAGEYEEAENLADQLDALIDLLVFALGSIELHGFSPVFYEAFERVMKANLQKELGPPLEKPREGKRKCFKFNLRKPEGWKPPDFSDLLTE